jgi:hypothetical protein
MKEGHSAAPNGRLHRVLVSGTIQAPEQVPSSVWGG